MPRCQVLSVYLLLLAGLIIPIAVSASTPLMIDPGHQFQFAEQLYAEGQFRRAAEEYERFAFFFLDDPRRRLAIFKAGQAFFQSGDGAAGLLRFDELTGGRPLDPVAVDAYFMSAECLLLLGNPNQAVLTLQNLISLSEDTTLQDRAYLRIGWIHIDQMDWAGAQRAFQRISAEGRAHHNIDALEAELAQSDHLPQKNPTLAGTLSIVPGAGQLYCGRYEDALAALVVNGGLFWAAYESFDHDLNALGGLLTLAGLGFYAGNIYGAVTDAHKYNQTQKQRFGDYLKHQVSFGVGTGRSSNRRDSSESLLVQIRINF